MSDLLTWGDAVATHARLRPDKLAVRHSQRDLTFAAWHERANRLANGLLDLGLDRGDRVVVLAYNCADRFAPIRADLPVSAGAYVGATSVIDDRPSFDLEALLVTLAKERITFASLVPTHYVMMLALPEATRACYDVSAVQRLLISSAPARQEAKLAILEQFPDARLYELYGSTEAGYVTVLHPEEQIAKLGSVGREWVGSWPIRLLDPEGYEIADGEVGELFSRTPYVFDGYWKDPAKTAECFQGPGWAER